MVKLDSRRLAWCTCLSKMNTTYSGLHWDIFEMFENVVTRNDYSFNRISQTAGRGLLFSWYYLHIITNNLGNS